MQTHNSKYLIIPPAHHSQVFPQLSLLLQSQQQQSWPQCLSSYYWLWLQNHTQSWRISSTLCSLLLFGFGLRVLLLLLLLFCEGTDSVVLSHVKIKGCRPAWLPMGGTWQLKSVAAFVCSNFRTRNLGLPNPCVCVSYWTCVSQLKSAGGHGDPLQSNAANWHAQHRAAATGYKSILLTGQHQQTPAAHGGLQTPVALGWEQFYLLACTHSQTHSSGHTKPGQKGREATRDTQLHGQLKTLPRPPLRSIFKSSGSFLSFITTSLES